MKISSEATGTSRLIARLRRRFGSESGQSLIELALLTPVLLILVVGIAEVGRYSYLDILVSNAARAGAAWGAQNLPSSADTTDITTAATNDCQNCSSLTTGALTVASSPVCTCDNGGSLNPNPPTSGYCNSATNATAGSCTVGHWVVMVQVSVTGTFKPMLTYPAGGLFGYLKFPSLTLSSTATERVAQ
jgi:Flp pilus assembly protein TadG